MDLTFIHWAVAPEVVAPFMPPGVRPDVFDGLSYVALVPFSMQRIGLFGAPAVPYFGSFLETNVRLYGVDGEGRRGVVFCSLEASRLATVALTRWTTGLNYLWARMRLQREGDRLEYTTHRRWPGPRGASSRVVVRGRTRYWPNEHATWPLRAATLEHLDDQLVAVAGFPGLVEQPPISVLHSSGVSVRFGPRRRAIHTDVTNW